MTKKRSREIRERVIRNNPGCSIRFAGITLTLVCSQRGHQVMWLDYRGRISEIDLGPRGAKIIA